MSRFRYNERNSIPYWFFCDYFIWRSISAKKTIDLFRIVCFERALEMRPLFRLREFTYYYYNFQMYFKWNLWWNINMRARNFALARSELFIYFKFCVWWQINGTEASALAPLYYYRCFEENYYYYSVVVECETGPHFRLNDARTQLEMIFFLTPNIL